MWIWRLYWRWIQKKNIKSNNGTISYPINDCVNEEWSVDEDDVQYNNVKDKIIVEKQELQFTDLEVGNVIVVPVKDKQKSIYYFPAEITMLNISDRTVNIDYLKTDFDNKKILRRVDSESEKNWNIFLVDIIMKLPKPKYHRGTFTFEKELFLYSHL